MFTTKRRVAADYGFSNREVLTACAALKIVPVVGALANGRAHGLTPKQVREVVAWVRARRRERARSSQRAKK